MAADCHPGFDQTGNNAIRPTDPEKLNPQKLEGWGTVFD